MTVLGQQDAISKAEVPRASGSKTVAVLVVAVLLVADLIAQLAGGHLRQAQTWPTLEMQHKFSLLTRVAAVRRTGVVLVGDSLLDADADPLEVDSRPGFVFNASLAAEPLPVLGPWVAKIVLPRLHPRVVVLGLSANALIADNPGQAVLVHDFARSRTVAHAEGRGDWVDDIDAWLTKHVALYRDRSVLREPFTVAATPSNYNPPLSAVGWNQGFVNSQLGSGPLAEIVAVAQVKNALFQGLRIDPAKVRELGSLIDTLRSEGTRVLLVAVPVSPYVPEALPGGTGAFQQAINVLLATGTAHGARAVNAGVWGTPFFADPLQLNEFGTMRFSRWLASQLSEVGA